MSVKDELSQGLDFWGDLSRSSTLPLGPTGWDGGGGERASEREASFDIAWDGSHAESAGEAYVQQVDHEAGSFWRAGGGDTGGGGFFFFFFF